VKTFPLLDTIQRKHSDQLAIIPVTSEDSAIVAPFLERFWKGKKIKVTSVVNDREISRRIKHKVIPHYVWIDKHGQIKAFTGSDEVSFENIHNLIQGIPLNIENKVDKMPISGSPFFLDNQWKYSDYPDKNLYNSIITKYNKQISNGAYRGKNYIDCPNHPIKALFQIAFGKFNLGFLNDNVLILEGFKSFEDSFSIGVYNREIPALKEIWKKSAPQNAYCYELAFKDSVVDNDYLFKFMQDDINRYFGLKGITGRLETRKVKVLALVRTSNETKFAAKQNESTGIASNPTMIDLTAASIGNFVTLLQASYYKWGNPPIVDRSGIKSMISMKIEADLKDVQEVNKELSRYDLKIVEMMENKEMIVITKKRLSN
ncbi:MAG: TlpA family protein disulfide reductase, partial [Sediminibacterium sp.]